MDLDPFIKKKKSDSTKRGNCIAQGSQLRDQWTRVTESRLKSLNFPGGRTGSSVTRGDPNLLAMASSVLRPGLWLHVSQSGGPARCSG